MLIEKLTGRLYRDFIREFVLQVANMHQSGFYAFNDLPENTANGYLEDRRTTNIYQLPLRGGGDGGMYTTTSDLRAFWESWFSYRILSSELTPTYLPEQITSLIQSAEHRIRAAVGHEKIRWTEYGSPDVLQLQDLANPAPQDDDVLIQIHAA